MNRVGHTIRPKLTDDTSLSTVSVITGADETDRYIRMRVLLCACAGTNLCVLWKGDKT